MYAVLSGKPQIVKLLLDAGADASVTNGCGMTALKLAESKTYRCTWQAIKRTPDENYAEIAKILKG